MRRRDFITGIAGSAIAWPLAARGQQPVHIRQVGILAGSSADDTNVQQGVAAFTKAMQQLGWTDGANIKFVLRGGSGRLDQTQAAARELVAAKPDVILGSSTVVLSALRQATDAIPIVFIQVTDPVAQGFVTNIAQPGGNITGFAHWESSMGGKWLRLLKEVSPRTAHVGVIFNPETAPYFGLFLPSVQSAIGADPAKLIRKPAQSPTEIENALTAIASEPDSGLIVIPDAFTVLHRKQIIALAASLRLPAIYSFAIFVADGGLMSYGINVPDIWRRSAAYVDRILKGAKPAELPIQFPNKFELLINLKTAKSLGVKISDNLRSLADDVIE